jgi:hypothetical protein
MTSEIITAAVAIATVLITQYFNYRNKKIDLQNSEHERLFSFKKDSFNQYYKNKLNFYLELVNKIKQFEKDLIKEDTEDILYDFYGQIDTIRGLPKEKIYVQNLKIILQHIDENILYADDEIQSIFTKISKIKQDIYFEYEHDIDGGNFNSIADVMNSKIYDKTFNPFKQLSEIAKTFFKEIDEQTKLVK